MECAVRALYPGWSAPLFSGRHRHYATFFASNCFRLNVTKRRVEAKAVIVDLDVLEYGLVYVPVAGKRLASTLKFSDGVVAAVSPLPLMLQPTILGEYWSMNMARYSQFSVVARSVMSPTHFCLSAVALKSPLSRFGAAGRCVVRVRRCLEPGPGLGPQPHEVICFATKASLNHTDRL